MALPSLRPVPSIRSTGTPLSQSVGSRLVGSRSGRLSGPESLLLLIISTPTLLGLEPVAPMPWAGPISVPLAGHISAIPVERGSTLFGCCHWYEGANRGRTRQRLV